MIDVSFYENIRSALLEFVSHISFSGYMPELANIMEFGMQEQFLTEGRYLGGRLGTTSFGYKWFDLAPSTIRQRQKKGYWPGKILQRTGILANSIFAQIDNSEIIFGTNIAYAEYLQEGTSKMPPRPLFPISTQLPNEMLNLIMESAEKYLKKTI